MSTLTKEQEQKITDFLKDRYLPVGLGDEEQACSIAAINLALTGRLTDKIPECMSPVIGNWSIVVQDAMPDEMRNSPEWKVLLPLAAGTGRNPDDEKKRLDLLLNWMWVTVLPSLQSLADEKGFGEAWETMCRERASDAAEVAANAAADGAANVADEAANVADEAAWETFNPVGLLKNLVEV